MQAAATELSSWTRRLRIGMFARTALRAARPALARRNMASHDHAQLVRKFRLGGPRAPPPFPLSLTGARGLARGARAEDTEFWRKMSIGGGGIVGVAFTVIMYIEMTVRRRSPLLSSPLEKPPPSPTCVRRAALTRLLSSSSSSLSLSRSLLPPSTRGSTSTTTTTSPSILT